MTGKQICSFSDRIKELYEESGKSYSELSRDLDVARGTIGLWIQGLNVPRKPTFYALAHYFNVSIPWLMGYDVEKHEYWNGITAEEKRLVAAYRAADARAREDAMKMLLDHPQVQEEQQSS